MVYVSQGLRLRHQVLGIWSYRQNPEVEIQIRPSFLAYPSFCIAFVKVLGPSFLGYPFALQGFSAPYRRRLLAEVQHCACSSA